MEKLIIGQKLKICEEFIQTKISISCSKPIELDVTCFGVDNKNKLSDDRYFIFYNQLQSPNEEIKKISSENANENIFEVHLDKLPNTINKLIFTIAIDGDYVMNEIDNGYFILSDKLKFEFDGSNFKDEKAIILAEIYKKDNNWRLCIISQGFNGGLSALLKHFGGVEEENTSQEPENTTVITLEQNNQNVSNEESENLKIKKKTKECTERNKYMIEEFANQLNQLATKILDIKANIQTEEATKMSLIIPFFQLLGYDVFNPNEFVPEYIADVGIKKGEKVDYAILENGVPIILIEAKWCGEKLEKHDGQLFRYFIATKAKFAILTNGIYYRFYTDLDEPNKLDEKPFLEINMLDLKESHINELTKFKKDRFDSKQIFSSASELKCTNIIKNILSEQFINPSDNFIRYLLSEFYEGVKTQNVIDRFRDMVKKSFNQFVNELINDRLKIALDTKKSDINNFVDNKDNTTQEVATTIEDKDNKILAIDEELQAFYIIKSILLDVISLDKITYKKTETYFGILYNNIRSKWICRIKIGDIKKSISFPDIITKETKYFNTLDEIFNFKSDIIQSVQRFVE